MHPIGEPIVRLESVSSTNALVLGREDYLERPGLVVLARHQTAGRGRIGRRWASVPGAQLQFSVVLHPRLAPADEAVVSLVIGLGVIRGLEAVLDGAEPRPELKWPNDVYLGGRKAVGILLERRDGGHGPRLVAGIGINVSGAPADFPAEVRERLTTLAHETGRALDHEAVLAAVLDGLREVLGRLEAGERGALLDAWRHRARLRGRRVRYQAGRDWRQGVARDIDGQGRLQVHRDDGGEDAVAAGVVEWLE